jgi:hypothetical protein
MPNTRAGNKSENFEEYAILKLHSLSVNYVVLRDNK